MSIKQKIKGLLVLQNYNEKGLADYFGISVQALRNKISRGSFSAEDLIKISTFLNASLSITCASGDRVELTSDDLKET